MTEPEFKLTLSGTPLAITPHIKRIVKSLKFNDLIYVIGEQKEPEEYSVELLLSYGKFENYAQVQNLRPSAHTAQPIKNKNAMHNIANINLQTLPNNKAIFILDYAGECYSDDHDALEHFIINIVAEFKKLEFYVFEDDKVLKQVVCKSNLQSVNDIFKAMQFHSKIVEASKSLFEDGHYSQAIFEAFKTVNNYVKNKANCDLDGKDLMAKAFNEKQPIIKLNGCNTESDINEQEGFRFIFMGAIVGIRNPKAHDNIIQNDPYKTLEYLGLASLLLRKAEEGTKQP